MGLLQLRAVLTINVHFKSYKTYCHCHFRLPSYLTDIFLLKFIQMMTLTYPNLYEHFELLRFLW